MGFDRRGGVTWTNKYFKAVKNRDMELAASMQQEVDDWAMDSFVRILDGCEFLDEVVEGVSRRCGLVEGYVSVPANVTAARVMFKNLATAADRTLDAPRLKRRAQVAPLRRHSVERSKKCFSLPYHWRRSSVVPTKL